MSTSISIYYKLLDDTPSKEIINDFTQICVERIFDPDNNPTKVFALHIKDTNNKWYSTAGLAYRNRIILPQRTLEKFQQEYGNIYSQNKVSFMTYTNGTFHVYLEPREDQKWTPIDDRNRLRLTKYFSLLKMYLKSIHVGYTFTLSVNYSGRLTPCLMKNVVFKVQFDNEVNYLPEPFIFRNILPFRSTTLPATKSTTEIRSYALKTNLNLHDLIKQDIDYNTIAQIPLSGPSEKGFAKLNDGNMKVLDALILSHYMSRNLALRESLYKNIISLSSLSHKIIYRY